MKNGEEYAVERFRGPVRAHPHHARHAVGGLPRGARGQGLREATMSALTCIRWKAVGTFGSLHHGSKGTEQCG